MWSRQRGEAWPSNRLLRACPSHRGQGNGGRRACRGRPLCRAAGGADADQATLRSNVQRATQVWAGIGARVLSMKPQEHDKRPRRRQPPCRICLPSPSRKPAPRSRRARSSSDSRAPGCRDFSRIAASDPAIWRDILAGQPRAGAAAVAGLPPGAGAVRSTGGRGRSRRTGGGDRQRQPDAIAVAAVGQLMFTTPFLDIPPLAGAAGTVRLPGSKSISNRVLLLAAPLRRHDHGARPARLGRHPRHAGCACGTGLRASSMCRAPCASQGLDGQVRTRQASLFSRQRGHRDAPAHGRAGLAGRQLRTARRGADARAAHRRPGRRIDPARLPRRLPRQPGLSAAGDPCRGADGADAGRADPRARRRIQPVPHRAAARAPRSRRRATS